MEEYGGPLLQDFFLQREESDADLVALSWLDDEGKDGFDLTFCQLRALGCLLAQEFVHLEQCIIPICLSKSPEMLISMLAVLLSGKGYCNMEPDVPLDRRKDIVKEAVTGRATVIGQMEGDFDCLDPTDLLRPALDAIKQGRELQAPALELPRPSPDSTAYLVYTSGSTGRPKGIAISHSNVVAFLRNYRNVFGRTRADDELGCRVLQFASYAFDVSVMSIWDTLAHGATVCLTTNDRLRSDLAGVVRDLKITHVDLTPTVSQLLLESFGDAPASLDDLESWRERTGCFIRQHGTGSEPVPRWLAQEWLKRGVALVNDYGPSETTVGVVSLQVDPTNQNWLASLESSYLPIGTPNGTNEIHLLAPDSDEIVETGQTGEICVGGPQVSTNGYVCNELNQGVFIDDPRFGRIYRTGDLGRWIETTERGAMLECLGRKDTQIKINGLRIEVAEIEQHLTSAKHPEIASAVVDKVDHPSGTSLLVAFLLLANEKTRNEPRIDKATMASSSFKELVEKLSSALSTTLPGYMMPRTWIALTSMPVQPSGKTDRKRLRQLAADHHSSAISAQSDQQPPTKDDKLDKAMLHAWSEVLHVEQDSLSDDDEWTKRGGDSIGFIRLVGNLRKLGYPRASFALLASAANLGEACEMLRRSHISPPRTSYEPFSRCPVDKSALHSELEEADIEDAWRVTPMQEALLAPAMLQKDFYHAQAVYAVDTRLADVKTLARGIDILVERHAMLRSTFVLVSEGSLIVQVVLKRRSQSKPICSIRMLAPSQTFEDAIEVRVLCIGDSWFTEAAQSVQKDHAAQGGAKFGRVPVAFCLLVSSEGVAKLCWSMHHALSDGWTLDLLHDDLALICAGRDFASRPSFGNVAQFWHTLSESKEAELYWSDYLESAEEPAWPKVSLEILPSTRSVAHRTWTGDLSPSLRSHGITPAIATRVAIYVALLKASALPDLMVGIVRSGRDIDVEGAENIIGPCVSTLPARCGMVRQKGATLLDLLQAETAIDRLARMHQRMTIAQLTKLAPRLPLGARLFTTLITYQSLSERAEDARLPISEPPESIVMPTVYALSIEITPMQKGFDLHAYYDDRCISAKEVDSLLKTATFALDLLADHLEEPLNGLLPPSRSVGNSPAVSMRIGQPSTNLGDEPPSDLIRIVQETWAHVLHVDKSSLNAESHWSRVAGTSILAMRLTALLNRQGLHIPVRMLGSLPSIRSQAAYLAHSR